MSPDGVGGMIQLGAWLENEHAMVVLTIGRSAVEAEDCVMEVCGQWLAFRVALVRDEVRLAAALMDTAGAPQTLLRARDDTQGWDLVRRLIAALEAGAIAAAPYPAVRPTGRLYHRLSFFGCQMTIWYLALGFGHF